MKRNLLLFFMFTITVALNAQLPIRFDNLYKTVYLNQAFRMMDSAKNYLLLDVRSPGEYADTSRFTGLNIGRLKGSVNIDVDAVEGRLKELNKYKDEPIFIYCSHSQRSRRISKLLTENGFKKVYNINGGMSVVNKYDAARFVYKKTVHETNTYHKNIASADAVNFIKNTPDLVIIDVRREPQFASKDTLVQNNIGHLKNAINIPYDVIADKLDSYKISTDKPVLLYDQYGQNSVNVVNVLKAKGFSRIYNLYAGLASFSSDHEANKNGASKLIVDAPQYKLLDARGAIDMLNSSRDLVIIDTRPKEEFENRSSVAYHNLGKIKGAVNINTTEALEDLIRSKNKSAPILIYHGMGGDLGAKTSDLLAAKGFKNVNYLSGGLYDLVWASANLEDCKEGKKFLVDHEGFY